MQVSLSLPLFPPEIKTLRQKKEDLTTKHTYETRTQDVLSHIPLLVSSTLTRKTFISGVCQHVEKLSL